MNVNDSTEKNVQRHTTIIIENNHHSCLNFIYPINMIKKEKKIQNTLDIKQLRDQFRVYFKIVYDENISTTCRNNMYEREKLNRFYFIFVRHQVLKYSIYFFFIYAHEAL